jgi:galactokinase
MANLENAFHEVFGHKAEVLAEAPGRVNLIGEHIDYSEGFVLPFAIADRTYAAIARNNDGLVRIASQQRKNRIFTIDIKDVQPGSAGEWEKYVLGVIWTMGVTSGVDILVDGHVPSGAGLSSSAALECSVAVGLNTLFNLGKSLEDMARATQKAENDYVGMPCGIMDQSVSLMGREGSALLLDCRDLTTESVPFDVDSAGLELLIIDTQAHHALVDGGYAERRASCESVAAKFAIPSMRHLTMDTLNSRKSEITETEYIRARHAVTEIQRVKDAVTALRANDFATLGRLINESHDSLRDDYTVSCVELDAAVDASRAAGALGARMVGGGFGGSAIALIKADRIESTKDAIKKAYVDKGFKAPRFFTSLPSPGASARKLG